MAVVLTCPQGHTWQAGDGDAAVPRDSCPVCGALANTIVPTDTPGGPGSESPTLAPAAAAPGEIAPEVRALLAPAEGPDELGRLGNYRVLAVLGCGGMGVVFKAEDVHLRRLVALKAMLPVLAVSPGNRARFQREAQAAAAIEHDHIVPIYQIGEDRGVPFLAMPLLRGESLNDRLEREGRLPVADVLRIGRETALGLAAAHERGLIHRDIKPANLWLETLPAVDGETPPSYRVKILDFGLARAAAEGPHLTQTGAILGTPAFMAPEQASGKPVDARADLFGLGCVLYRLCTGRLPFVGSDAISTLMAVAMEQPPPPAQLDPALPPALSALVMRLLAKDPADRPASAREVALALPEAGLAACPTAEPEVVFEVLPESAADETAVVLDALPAAPPQAVRDEEVRRKKERDSMLYRKGATLGAAVLGILGLVVGGVIGLITGAASGNAGYIATGFLLGPVVGAVAGLFVGPFAAGVYDGYLTAERERRRQQRRP